MPVISDVIISNMALGHVGADDEIEALDEDSVAAAQCNLWYDQCRRQALADFDWTFARRRQALAEHSDDPPSGIWTYRYIYPQDCVKLRRLQPVAGDAADAIPFDVELNDEGTAKTILTDLEDAVAIYTRNITDAELFSMHFVDMLSHLLGYRIAYKLTGKRTLKTEMQRVYQALLLVAPAKDANERVAQPPRDADYIRGR